MRFRGVSGGCLLAAMVFAGPALSGEAGMNRGFAGRTYIEARAGFPFPQPYPMKIRNSAGAAASGTQVYKFSSAYVGALIAGHYLTDNIRLELELSHLKFFDGRARFASGFTGNPFAGTKKSGSGNMKTYGVMFNALYDFDIPDWRLRPFVGIGGGVYDLKATKFGPTASPFKITDHAIGYTGCLLAGFTYPVHRRIDFTMRYTGVIKSKVKVSDFTGGQRVTATSPFGFGQGLSVGLRVWLN